MSTKPRPSCTSVKKVLSGDEKFGSGKSALVMLARSTELFATVFVAGSSSSISSSNIVKIQWDDLDRSRPYQADRPWISGGNCKSTLDIPEVLPIRQYNRYGMRIFRICLSRWLKLLSHSYRKAT